MRKEIRSYASLTWLQTHRTSRIGLQCAGRATRAFPTSVEGRTPAGIRKCFLSLSEAFAEVHRLPSQRRSGIAPVLSCVGCGFGPPLPGFSAAGRRCEGRGAEQGWPRALPRGSQRFRGGTASTSRACFKSYPMQTIFCVPPPDVQSSDKWGFTPHHFLATNKLKLDFFRSASLQQSQA